MTYFNQRHHSISRPSPVSSTSQVYPQHTTMTTAVNPSTADDTPSIRRKLSSSSTLSNSSTSSPVTSRPSSVSFPSSSSLLTPRVQLIPHTRTYSFDTTLSPSERQALENTSFNDLDLSSKDFDFEDIFTYGRPTQHKLNRVVEVSSPARESSWSAATKTHRQQQKERDWGIFSFSHFSSALPTTGSGGAGGKEKERSRAVRSRSGIGGMYVRNGIEARRR